MKTIKLSGRGASLILLVMLVGCTAPGIVPIKTESLTEDLATSVISTATNATITSISIATAAYTPQAATLTPDSRPTAKPTFTREPTKTRAPIPGCPGNGIPVPIPEDSGFPKTIVYQDGNGKGLYTIGGAPLIWSQLPVSETQENEILGFSLDGEWLAYAPMTRKSTLERGINENGDRTVTGTVVFETPSIVLLSASGERIEHTLDVTNLGFYEDDYQLEEILGFPESRWINDHLLYVILLYENPTDPYGKPLWLPKVLDPFTGDWLNESFDKLNRSDLGQVGFSPDMSLALYETYGIAIQDLSSEVEIWSDPSFFYYPRAVIRWAPNNSWVAVSNITFFPERGWDQILLVSRDGEVKVIADVTFPSIGMIEMQWSPDSRYLALIIMDDTRGSVYLYDSATDQYLYSCPLLAFGEWSPNLIWSPDSRYIALSVARSPNLPLHVLDVETGEIFELTKNANAVGWSDKFPTVWP